MSEREDISRSEQPAGSEPSVFGQPDSELQSHRAYCNDEIYTPTKEIEKALTFNSDLLAELKLETPKANKLKLIERYCQTTTRRIAEIEPDAIKAQAANDGNNITSPIIMSANFEGGDDDHKFVESGRDLEIARDILADKTKREYDNLSAYKLWAGLYLDLREELFGPEQGEENIELINQLRERIAE